MLEAVTPQKMAVFVSGRGSNLKALHAAAQCGDLHAAVALVVASGADAPALTWAHEHNIPTTVWHPREGGDALNARLASAHIDLVVLAGFMKKLPAPTVAAFRGRAVNIHPAPLPRFGGPGMYGIHVHEAVLASGEHFSGPTVHLVSENYDEGPILAHTPVPVLPDDSPHTLAARVLQAEHALYAATIEQYLSHKAHG